MVIIKIGCKDTKNILYMQVKKCFFYMLLIIPYKTSLTPAICNMLIFKIDYHLSPSRVCNIYKEKARHEISLMSGKKAFTR